MHRSKSNCTGFKDRNELVIKLTLKYFFFNKSKTEHNVSPLTTQRSPLLLKSNRVQSTALYLCRLVADIVWQSFTFGTLPFVELLEECLVSFECVCNDEPLLLSL